jgi:hypothetical protein
MFFVTPKDMLNAVAEIKSYIVGKIEKVVESVDAKIGDAPANGKPHVRKDNKWEKLNLPEQQELTPANENELLNQVKELLK